MSHNQPKKLVNPSNVTSLSTFVFGLVTLIVCASFGIVSKNVSVNYKGVKINIIDTPGHADFGGEVERVLKMADGVILLVDAFEGAMPQTRFVTQKALSLGLKPVVIVNKVDKENCRPEEVYESIFELFLYIEL